VLTNLLPASAEQALLFATAVFVLNATPGVDFLLTVSRTLQGGARAGIAAVAGINAGCIVHALAAASGLAALLAVWPAAFNLIQWAGAAYLVWLGLGMLRQAWPSAASSPASLSTLEPAREARQSLPWRANFRAGLLTNILNPKVALFFLAFLPQFVPSASPHPTLSFLLLGLWFVLQGGLFSLALVAVAAQMARWGGSHRLRRILNGLGGLAFIGLALRLLLQKPNAG
jgi:threonine/homoserine/homoserine lactone efflux protein